MNIEGLQKFIESANIDNKLIHQASVTELKESISKIPNRLRESVTVEADDAAGWWVPISYYNKLNGNNRNYNEELWDNVLNNQRDTWVGSPMLADHPADDSDGSPKDICGIWLDGKKGKAEYPGGPGLVYGLLMPSGRLGEDLKEHLKNGLKVGTSSSGYGKLLSDGKTVDPDSYMIERLSDWVLNPSQGTFFVYNENNDSDNLEESLDKKEITKKDIVKETKVVKDPIITKLEEKRLRRDMESFLESATAIEDPQERLQEFKEIKSYLEDGACPDLREKIEEKIAAEEALIKTAIKEKLELKNTYGIENPKDLEEKLTRVVEEASEASKQAKDWKEISEKLQAKLEESNKILEERPTHEFVSYQESKIKSLEEKIEVLSEKTLKTVKSMASVNKSLKEKIYQYQETIKGLEEEKAKMFDEFKSNNANAAEKKTLAEALTVENNSLKEELKSLKEKISEMDSELNESKNTVISKEKDISNLKIELEESKGVHNDKLSEINNFIENLNKTIDEQRASIEKLTEDNITLKNAYDKKSKQVNSLAHSLKESQFNLYSEISKQPAPVTRKLNDKECLFEALYQTYGNEVIPFKERIINAINITEAKNVFYREVLPQLRDSKKVDRARVSEALSKEERQQKMRLPLKESSISNRKPEGWL